MPTKYEGKSNINFWIPEEKKNDFASKCKRRKLSMTEVLESDIDRHLSEWENDKSKKKSIVSTSEPVVDKQVSLSIVAVPESKPVTEENKESKYCIVCRTHPAIDGTACSSCKELMKKTADKSKN